MTDSTSTLLRLHQLRGHLSGGSVKAAQKPKSPEDIVIIAAVRTPFTKAKKGGLKALHEEDMLATVFKAIIDRTGIDPALVEDIKVGTALPPLCGQPLSRIAAIYAGFPYTTSVATVNRQCSSGLQACADVVAAVKSGFVDIGVAGGAESMTKYYGNQAPDTYSEKILTNKTARNCLIPMGITSENVASRFHISREDQDAFGLRSHQLAAKAQKAGLFDEEIVPTDDGSGNIITKDDGIRGNTTLEGLAKLKPSFKEGGSTTAGQSSQVTDGAGAALIMRRDRAEQLGLKPLARWLGFAVAGVPPEIMGIGPEVAIPKVLDQVGLTKDDIDIYEINEAFASQALHCVRKLGIPLEKVNPNGGAIALGHPFGATGLRQIATTLPELRRQKQKYMVASMCIGTGMGAAAVIENEVL